MEKTFTQIPSKKTSLPPKKSFLNSPKKSIYNCPDNYCPDNYCLPYYPDGCDYSNSHFISLPKFIHDKHYDYPSTFYD